MTQLRCILKDEVTVTIIKFSHLLEDCYESVKAHKRAVQSQPTLPTKLRVEVGSTISKDIFSDDCIEDIGERYDSHKRLLSHFQYKKLPRFHQAI